jgi:hypothetical protein
MNLRNLRQWQWILIGAAIGLSIGAVRVVCGPGHLQSTARTLSQPIFERAITASPRGSFRLSDLVIHPPDATGAYWVTGNYRETGAGAVTQSPFKFRAATPYHPQLAVDIPDPESFTVAAYLDQIAARIPDAQLRYSYAWHEQPLPAILAWFLGATLLIGGIWPLIVRLLSGPRAAGTSPASLPPAPYRRADDAIEQVEIIAFDLRQDIDPAAAPISQTIPCAGGVTAPIRPLQADPLDVSSNQPPKDEKDYRGEFYPTVAHARKTEMRTF